MRRKLGCGRRSARCWADGEGAAGGSESNLGSIRRRYATRRIDRCVSNTCEVSQIN